MRSCRPRGGGSTAVSVIGALLLQLPYLIFGPGFILDDWYLLRNGQLHGWWRTLDGELLAARPGSGLVYALTFGLIGDHPLIHALIEALLIAAIAVLLDRLLSHFVSPRTAAAVALLWVALPNKTSLEVWASAQAISVALLATVFGCLLVAQGRRDLMAVAPFVFAGLTYEATIPIAAVATVAIPWILDGAVDRRFVRRTWGMLALAGSWVVLNFPSVKKDTIQLGDVRQVLPAHFSTSVSGQNPVSVALGTVAVGVSVLAAYRLVCGRRGQGKPTLGWEEHLIAAGWVVLAVGVAPFAFYFYSPIGAGDRVTVVSAVGGAMVWVGVFGFIARYRRGVAGVLLVGLLVPAFLVRLGRQELYATAGDDARAVLAEIAVRFEDPPPLIYVGPEPIMRINVGAFYDRSNIQAALQYLYGDTTITAYLTQRPEDFYAQDPALRYDLGPASRLDDVDLGWWMQP